MLLSQHVERNLYLQDATDICTQHHLTTSIHPFAPSAEKHYLVDVVGDICLWLFPNPPSYLTILMWFVIFVDAVDVAAVVDACCSQLRSVGKILWVELMFEIEV